jgi:hypothetical protein
MIDGAQPLSGSVVRVGSNKVRSCSDSEEVDNFCQYLRALQTPIGIDDELAGLGFVNDASTRKFLIFVIGDRLRNTLLGESGTAELLPPTPDIVVSTRMGQEITVGLGFRERALIGKNPPRMIGIGNTPIDANKAGHESLPGAAADAEASLSIQTRAREIA